MADVVEKFRNESVNGIPISVLKSAVQKYARRGLLEDGLCVLGLLSFFTEPRITTNVTNRLVVCMSEEVNIHEIYLPVMMMELHRKYVADRDPSVWLEMYTLLCRSRKCRLVSDAKTRWNLPPYKAKLPRLDQLHRVLLEKNGIPFCDDDREQSTAVADLGTALREHDWDGTFNVLRRLLRQAHAPRGMEKDIWGVIASAAEMRDERLVPVVGALRYFHGKLKHAERPIYMYHAILLIRHAPSLDYASQMDATVPESLEHWRRQGSRLTLKSFPGFVIDRHTTLARGESSVVFAEVGAWIPNEDKRFLNEEHRRLYHAFKVLQENV